MVEAWICCRVSMAFITARKRILWKVMFSQASFCPCGESRYPGHLIGHLVGYPCLQTWDLGNLLSWIWGLNTLPPWTLDLDTLPPRQGTWIPYLLLLTFDGHHWRFVQTSSLEDSPPLRHWHLVVAIKARMVGERTVSILLECCFVMQSIFSGYYHLSFSYFELENSSN